MPMDDPRQRPMPFLVTGVEASIPDGVPIEVEGRKLGTGPVTIRLDDEAPPESSFGVFDYETGKAQITFRLRFDCQEIREALRWAGLEETIPAPLRAVLRSEGDILADHSLALTGSCDFARHDMFEASALRALVLPGT